jgi:uncharacterized protein involved in cysteine biosynthesis
MVVLINEVRKTLSSSWNSLLASIVEKNNKIDGS